MLGLQGMYQEIILDHYKHPHRRGLREPFDVEVHHVNPTCGDEVTLRVKLVDQVIGDVSYEGQGCSISQASASVLTDLVVGHDVAEALHRYESFHELMTGKGQVEPDEELLEDGVAFAGVAQYPMRVKCALLAWSAFKAATARAIEQATDRTPDATQESA